MFQLESMPTSHSRAIVITTSALLGIGVVMVFSASASLTSPPLTQDLLRNSSVRQALFTLVGLIALLMVGLCPYESWRWRPRRLVQPVTVLLMVAVGLLVAVLLFGEERNGAKRWLSLGPASAGLSFQPSEVAKLAVVLFLAAYCSHLGDRLRRFWLGLVPAVVLLGVVAGLVGKEDLGTGALLLAVGGCILLAAGARWWHLAFFSVPALAGLVYLIKVEPYRVQRIMSFLNPESDPQNTGYHQIQSLITIASGGWWGRGLGAGIQKFGYLPEGRSDFVFAVICEELGLVGGAAVIGLFALLIWHGWRVATAANTPFGRLLALGVALTLGFQATMNIAVVTVTVPTKGIGLPFVSAGGTGVIFLSIMVGMLVNVARMRPAAIAVAASEPPASALPANPAAGT